MNDKAVVEGHSIRRTMRIDAPRETVWSALTEPAQIAKWFGDTASFEAFEVGATGLFTWEGYGSFPVLITEITPMDAFGYQWSGEPAETLRDDDSTTVRFSLTDDGSATTLTVVESGFESISGGTAHRRRRLDQNREGWNDELDELAALLEGE